ncbi:MAG TPA: TetR/AcrR family transcriptional regulator [Methylophilaceae bacterium]
MAPAGRPRTFDRDEALKKAMLVFWDKGFEGTTMSDIIDAIGMKAPSVYAAFGNKDALFDEVVQLYAGIFYEGPLKALNSADDIGDAIEHCLKAHIEMFTGQEGACSCLLLTAANNCSPEHQQHVVSLRNLRAGYKGALLARFKRAVADGQLTDDANPESLTEFYATCIQGMAMCSKDGASKKSLLDSCEYALGVLKPFLKKA